MKLHPSLTTVTPVTKALALILFITLPIVTFIIGINYGYKFGMTEEQIIETKENLADLNDGIKILPEVSIAPTNSIAASVTPRASVSYNDEASSKKEYDIYETTVYKYKDGTIEENDPYRNYSYSLMTNNDNYGWDRGPIPTYLKIIYQEAPERVISLDLGVIDTIDDILWIDSNNFLISLEIEGISSINKVTINNKNATLATFDSLKKYNNIIFGKFNQSRDKLYVMQTCKDCEDVPGHIISILDLNFELLKSVESYEGGVNFIDFKWIDENRLSFIKVEYTNTGEEKRRTTQYLEIR